MSMLVLLQQCLLTQIQRENVSVSGLMRTHLSALRAHILPFKNAAFVYIELRNPSRTLCHRHWFNLCHSGFIVSLLKSFGIDIQLSCLVESIIEEEETSIFPQSKGPGCNHGKLRCTIFFWLSVFHLPLKKPPKKLHYKNNNCT